MTDQAWKTAFWPEGVAHTITDYKYPIFKFLDASAEKYPDNVFTIFNGASKTFAQVLDTVTRISNFLTSKEIGKGYFLTGDIGHIDDEGYILITDRKKDMIVVGGFNVYPRDVEDILYTHPKVELCAVIGIPDEKSGEKVKAFIKLKQGKTADQDEIMAYCKENMAGYKRPRSVEFRDEIPISNIGKVLRRVLRDEAMRGV